MSVKKGFTPTPICIQDGKTKKKNRSPISARKRQMERKLAKGFTLVELMVVILIVAILASVAIPIMRGRIDAAKWSEAAATAGTIRVAVKAALTEDPAVVEDGDNLGDEDVRAALKFGSRDLEGTYFGSADYTITSTDADNDGENITITVTPNSDKPDAPEGTGVLSSAGWNVTES
ncbi:MAG: Fimbrial protein precursor [Planctomycetes bacterium ADurb.Bin401]|nr:MAG: Fimbrial protein precursor [Planctomycetes bacterium ADurb.Bin401]